MSKFKKNFINFEGFICTCLLIFTLFILTWQIIARAVGSSNSWSEELARYCFMYLIFMGAAMAAETVSHITIETMIKIWPMKIRRYMEILGTIIFISFCIFIVYYSTNFTLMLWESKRISLGLYIPMAIPYASIPIGYGFAAFRIAQRQLIPMLKKQQIVKEEVEL